MSLITLEIGPVWKMHLLRNLLEDRGVPAFVADSNMKTIDPFVTGAMSFDARLQVPDGAVEEARAALEEVGEGAQAIDRRPGGPRAQVADRTLATPDLQALADLGHRIRWAAILFWMHPFLFVYGLRYLISLRRASGRPAGHGLTLVALMVVTLLWAALSYVVINGGL